MATVNAKNGFRSCTASAIQYSLHSYSPTRHSLSPLLSPSTPTKRPPSSTTTTHHIRIFSATPSTTFTNATKTTLASQIHQQCECALGPTVGKAFRAQAIISYFMLFVCKIISKVFVVLKILNCNFLFFCLFVFWYNTG
jgi:hypothetical protein